MVRQNIAKSLFLIDQTETCIAFLKKQNNISWLKSKYQNVAYMQTGPTAPAFESCQMFTVVAFCPVLCFHS